MKDRLPGYASLNSPQVLSTSSLEIQCHTTDNLRGIARPRVGGRELMLSKTTPSLKRCL